MGKTTSRTSIILPTYNRAGYIRASLDSLLRQTRPPAQIIVVNDGCTDETEAVLRSYRDRILYLVQDNAGKPSAINTALHHVTGDYIWVFDDDDIACDDALERHVATLERHPEAAFTFGHSYHCTSHPQTGTLCIHHERRIPQFEPGDDYFRLLMSSYVASPAVVVRASVQETAGPYQEGLDRSEDWEVALRWGLVGPAVRTRGAGPTYYRRFHDGLRGSRGKQFPYAENARRSLEMERDILRSFSALITLENYLPRRHWNNGLDAAIERTARLRRITVCARRGMMNEVAADMELLEASGFSAETLTHAERQLLSSAFPNLVALESLRTVDATDRVRDLLQRTAFQPLRRLWSRRLAAHVRNHYGRFGVVPAIQVTLAQNRLCGPSSLLHIPLRQRALEPTIT